MAEGVGLEPTSPKAPVFKTGGLPVILTLRDSANHNGREAMGSGHPYCSAPLPPSANLSAMKPGMEKPRMNANLRELRPRRECVADPAPWPTKECVYI